MAKFGKTSIDNLRTAHIDLQLICSEAIKIYDFSVIEGLRSDVKQKEYYDKGLSKCDGVDTKSKHQANSDGVSMAVDIAPYPIDWSDTSRFFYLAGIMMSVSDKLYKKGYIKHKLRWGRDWDMDSKFDDNRFNDYPHFELVEV
jgi:peptidoglycan L-alanyl-D-glutamate endopeptidase CwlK